MVQRIGNVFGHLPDSDSEVRGTVVTGMVWGFQNNLKSRGKPIPLGVIHKINTIFGVFPLYLRFVHSQLAEVDHFPGPAALGATVI